VLREVQLLGRLCAVIAQAADIRQTDATYASDADVLLLGKQSTQHHQLIQTVLNYVMFVLYSAAVHLEELHEVVELAMDVTTCRKDEDNSPAARSCATQAAVDSVPLLVLM
jgi:hypothetical protein